MSESESAESEVSELSASDFAASGLSASESSVADSLVSESVVSESASAESEVAESSASDSLVSDSLVSASSAASDVAVSESSAALSDVLDRCRLSGRRPRGCGHDDQDDHEPAEGGGQNHDPEKRRGAAGHAAWSRCPSPPDARPARGTSIPNCLAVSTTRGIEMIPICPAAGRCRAVGGATNIEGSSAAAAGSPPGGTHTAPRTMASLTISSPLRRTGHPPDRRSETSFHSN